MLAQDCCAPLHQGTWARSAVDLAMARISALTLGLPSFLADTTHPDSLDALHGRRRLLHSSEVEVRRFQSMRLRVIDAAAGPYNDDDDNSDASGPDGKPSSRWVVAMVVEGLVDGEQREELRVNSFHKHGGRWAYYGTEGQLPDSSSFLQFYERNSRFFRVSGGERLDSWAE
jgi:hypothetical protein